MSTQPEPALIDVLTDDVLKNLGFERNVELPSDAGQVYWRGETLAVVVERRLLHLHGYPAPVGRDPRSVLPLWTITFTQETPWPLVTAALRRAGDYEDVMRPR